MNRGRCNLYTKEVRKKETEVRRQETGDRILKTEGSRKGAEAQRKKRWGRWQGIIMVII